MRPIRRNDMSPRLEMTPLIDVIFLLLTFFVFSAVMMVQAQVLPVKLTPLAGGTQATEAMAQVVSVDALGRLRVNREMLSSAELAARMAQWAAQAQPMSLYLTMEAQGQVDRGPILLQLVSQARAAGLRDVVFVGQDGPGPSSQPAGPGE